MVLHDVYLVFHPLENGHFTPKNSKRPRMVFSNCIVFNRVSWIRASFVYFGVDVVDWPQIDHRDVPVRYGHWSRNPSVVPIRGER